MAINNHAWRVGYGSNAPFGRSKRATYKPMGTPELSGTAGLTRHIAISLGTRFVGLTVRLYNAHTSAVTYSASVCAPDVQAAGAYSDQAWTRVLFGGANTVSVPAATAVIPNGVLGSVESDLVPVESGLAQIICGRTYCNSANNSRFIAGITPSMNLPVHGFETYWQNGVDGVSDPTALNAAQGINTGPPMAFRLYTRADVCKVAIFGASTGDGYGDAVGAGWATRARELMRAQGKHVAIEQHSVYGSNTASHMARARVMIPLTMPDVCVFDVTVSNDSGDADWNTPAYLARRRSELYEAVELARQYGAVPVFLTYHAPVGYSGTQNDYRKQLVETIRAGANEGHWVAFDIAKSWTDETQAVGAWIGGSAFTDDGAHGNAAGQNNIARRFVRTLESVLNP